jgi:VWFA-related protein
MHVGGVARAGACVGLALTFASAGLAASPAAGAEAPREIAIRRVDVAGFPEVRLRLLSVGGTLEARDVDLRENGQAVARFRLDRIDTSQSPAAVVLAIDTSGSMAGRGAVERVKTAARSFVASRRPGDRIAIVAYNDTARVVSDFSSDTARLVRAVDGLAAGGNTALWDAVVVASRMSAAQRGAQRFVVVLSDASADSYDNRSTATAAAARKALVRARATAFTVGLPSGPVDDHEYRALAVATGGVHITATDAGQVEGIFGQIQGSIRDQYELVYRSPAAARTLDIRVATGTLRATSRVTVPAGAAGRSDRAAEAAPPDARAPGEAAGDGFPLPSWQLLALAWIVVAVIVWRRPRPRRARGLPPRGSRTRAPARVSRFR